MTLGGIIKDLARVNAVFVRDEYGISDWKPSMEGKSRPIGRPCRHHGGLHEKPARRSAHHGHQLHRPLVGRPEPELGAIRGKSHAACHLHHVTRASSRKIHKLAGSTWLTQISKTPS